MERTPRRTSGSRPVVAIGWNSWNTIWNLGNKGEICSNRVEQLEHYLEPGELGEICSNRVEQLGHYLEPGEQ